MKLFYYDKFLESYADLPKQIQKKVMDFVQKFKNDSTSASIHLEPIATFKDPQLRTARVDLKYRAILHVSATGDVSHLLWVDNHDEAMRWAENKVFEWNKNTQTYQVYESQPTSIVEKSRLDAAQRNALCSSFSDEQLLQIGVPYPLLPSVKAIDNLGDLENLETYLPRQAFENIYYILDGLDINDVVKEIEEGKVSSETLEEQIVSPNNLRSFFEVTNDSDIEELLNGDLNKWKIFLHPTQRMIANNNFSSSYKVSGAAGTGKTVLALHRLKNLSIATKKNRSILFTTFTKSLVNNLKDAVSGLGVELDKVLITNIHNFIVEKAKTEGLIQGNSKILDFLGKEAKEELWRECIESLLSEYDTEFLMKEYEDVVLLNNIKTLEEYLKVPRVGLETPLGRKERLKVWDIISHFIKLKNTSNIYYMDEVTNLLTNHYSTIAEKPFLHIIADEIQDFSNTELRLLRVLVAEKENDLFLVGDPLQKIYKRNINFSKAGINIRGQRSKRLKVNYRTTEEIKKSAIAVINKLTYDDFDGSTENKSGYVSILHGEPPKYDLFKTTEEMNEGLFKIINQSLENDLVKPREICIAARTKKSMSEAKKFVHGKKMAYFDLTDMVGDKTGIVLSTFHNIKGLEYKVVILYDVSNETVPNKHYTYSSLKDYDKKIHDQSERSLLYVAMTRAIKRLYIVGVGGACEWLSIKHGGE